MCKNTVVVRWLSIKSAMSLSQKLNSESECRIRKPSFLQVNLLQLQVQCNISKCSIIGPELWVKLWLSCLGYITLTKLYRLTRTLESWADSLSTHKKCGLFSIWNHTSLKWPTLIGHTSWQCFSYAFTAWFFGENSLPLESLSDDAVSLALNRSNSAKDFEQAEMAGGTKNEKTSVSNSTTEKLSSATKQWVCQVFIRPLKLVDFAARHTCIS